MRRASAFSSTTGRDRQMDPRHIRRCVENRPSRAEDFLGLFQHTQPSQVLETGIMKVIDLAPPQLVHEIADRIFYGDHGLEPQYTLDLARRHSITPHAAVRV